MRAGWILVCLFSSGCANPTEVVVFVDTTLGVPCEVDAFRIVVQGEGAPVERVVPADDGQISWTVLKDSGGDDFNVSADAMKLGRVVASGLANVSFSDADSRKVEIVLGSNCAAAPCDFSESLSVFDDPAGVVRDTCEGKASRYTYRDQTGLVDVIDACALAAGPFQSFSGLDNSEVPIDDSELTSLMTSAFEFRLYGQRVERAWISDDGYVSFGVEPAGATFDRVNNMQGLTSPGHPSFAVVPFWENLVLPAPRQACVAMQNAGGRDTLWITWKNACLDPCAQTDQLEFSVGLEEETNRIVIGYTNMLSPTEPDRAAGGLAVVGIIREDEPACSADECRADGLCADGSTPCGFTQVFSRKAQTSDWPATFVFDPVSEE